MSCIWGIWRVSICSSRTTRTMRMGEGLTGVDANAQRRIKRPTFSCLMLASGFPFFLPSLWFVHSMSGADHPSLSFRFLITALYMRTRCICLCCVGPAFFYTFSVTPMSHSCGQATFVRHILLFRHIRILIPRTFHSQFLDMIRFSFSLYGFGKYSAAVNSLTRRTRPPDAFCVQ